MLLSRKVESSSEIIDSIYKDMNNDYPFGCCTCVSKFPVLACIVNFRLRVRSFVGTVCLTRPFRSFTGFADTTLLAFFILILRIRPFLPLVENAVLITLRVNILSCTIFYSSRSFRFMWTSLSNCWICAEKGRSICCFWYCLLLRTLWMSHERPLISRI